MLAQKGYQVRFLDRGFFRDCLLSPAVEPPEQIVKDIRDLEREDLDGIAAVVNLAGLSNDPLGEWDESLTEAINYDGSMRLGELARNSGVRRPANRCKLISSINAVFPALVGPHVCPLIDAAYF